MKELTLHRLLVHTREWYGDRIIFMEALRVGDVRCPR